MKPKNLENTTDPPFVTYKLYHIMVHRVHFAWAVLSGEQNHQEYKPRSRIKEIKQDIAEIHIVQGFVSRMSWGFCPDCGLGHLFQIFSNKFFWIWRGTHVCVVKSTTCYCLFRKQRSTCASVCFSGCRGDHVILFWFVCFIKCCHLPINVINP